MLVYALQDTLLNKMLQLHCFGSNITKDDSKAVGNPLRNGPFEFLNGQRFNQLIAVQLIKKGKHKIIFV